MSLWTWLLTGPPHEPRGSVYAFRELMKIAQADLDHGGELKPAKVLHRTAHPRKVLIGQFQARLLRMRRQG